jgi:alpha-galactosidase
MSIRYDENNRIFHLQSGDASYVLGVTKQGYLAHYYWGRKVRGTGLRQLLELKERASFSPSTDLEQKELSLDSLPQEYPTYGSSDFRMPAFQAQLADGTTVTEFLYDSHRIVKGKPSLPGLPAVYVESDDEAETLLVDLVDANSGLRVTLSYTAFADHSAIARSASVVNESGAAVKLLRAFSASFDLPHDRFELLQLSGAWSRERYASWYRDFSRWRAAGDPAAICRILLSLCSRRDRRKRMATCTVSALSTAAASRQE